MLLQIIVQLSLVDGHGLRLDVVHPRDAGRFAQMADGKKITPS